MVQRLSNLGQTTLLGSIISSATSLVVASAATFPTSGDFVIKIGDELIKVTNVSGTTFTIVRAQEGTTATFHDDTDPVNQVLTKGVLTTYFGDAVGSDTYTNRLATSDKTKLFFPSDNFIGNYSNGSTWLFTSPSNRVCSPPIATDFTWNNQSTATVDNTNGYMLFKNLTANSQFCSLLRALPATNFTLKIGFYINSTQDTSNSFGIVLRNSGNDKRVYFRHEFSSGGRLKYLRSDYTNLTTLSGNTNNRTPFRTGPMWGQLMYLSGSRQYHHSSDGSNFNQIETANRNDFLTPDQVGLFVYCVTGTVSVSVYHWETASV